MEPDSGRAGDDPAFEDPQGVDLDLGDLGEAVYELEVSAVGFAASPVRVTVGEAGGNAGEIVLTRAGAVDETAPSARCEDPVYDDIEACEAADAVWVPETVSDKPVPKDTGTFRFEGLPAGTYRIEIQVAGFLPAARDGVTVVRGPRVAVSRSGWMPGLPRSAILRARA